MLAKPPEKERASLPLVNPSPTPSAALEVVKEVAVSDPLKEMWVAKILRYFRDNELPKEDAEAERIA